MYMKGCKQMSKITGLTPITPKKLLLDAGAFYKNYDLEKSFEQNAGALIGATSGGGSFSAVPTVRQMAVDGAKTYVRELQTIDGWTVTMVANVKEITADTLRLALGAADVEAGSAAPTGVAGHTKITGREDFTDGDYVDNLTWVGRLSGSQQPVIVVIKNALSLNGLTLTVADKNEAVVPITVTGHYGLEDLDATPFEIYYPPEA